MKIKKLFLIIKKLGTVLDTLMYLKDEKMFKEI